MSTEQGLVNGSIGIVRNIIYNELLERMTSIIVDFITLNGMLTHEVCIKTEKVENYKRVQFPITLAYALTVHKVQGMTLAALAISKIHKYWDKAQLYVVVSRVRKFEHLYFIVPEGKDLSLNSYRKMNSRAEYNEESEEEVEFETNFKKQEDC